MTLLPDIRLAHLSTALAIMSGGLLFGAWWWFPFAAATAGIACLAVLDFNRVRAGAPRVTAELSVPASAQRGETIEVTIEVHNASPREMVVSLRPILPEQGEQQDWKNTVKLTAGNQAILTVSITAPIRGDYTFDGIWLRVASPWRMVQAQTHQDTKRICRVFPDVRRVKELLISRRVRSAGSPLVRTATLRGMGSDFESLRDYELGDDIRRIDWRATAKHAHLITRNYEIEPDRNVMVLLDRGRLMGAKVGDAAKLDHAVDAALMISAVALDSGDRCGLLVFDRVVANYLPPRQSIAYLPTFVDALTDLQPVFDETYFLRAFSLLKARMTKRSLVVVLSDVIDMDVSKSMVEAILALSKQHLVVLAALRTPAVYQVISNAAVDRMAPFRKTVAYRLRRERQEVITRLQKGGVFVLDVQPDELTVPLINKYIEVREQNRL